MYMKEGLNERDLDDECIACGAPTGASDELCDDCATEDDLMSQDPDHKNMFGTPAPHKGLDFKDTVTNPGRYKFGEAVERFGDFSEEELIERYKNLDEKLQTAIRAERREEIAETMEMIERNFFKKTGRRISQQDLGEGMSVFGSEAFVFEKDSPGDKDDYDASNLLPGDLETNVNDDEGYEDEYTEPHSPNARVTLDGDVGYDTNQGKPPWNDEDFGNLHRTVSSRGRVRGEAHNNRQKAMLQRHEMNVLQAQANYAERQTGQTAGDCETCNGTGFAYHDSQYEPETDTGEKIKCWDCGGTGDRLAPGDTGFEDPPRHDEADIKEHRWSKLESFNKDGAWEKGPHEGDGPTIGQAVAAAHQRKANRKEYCDQCGDELMPGDKVVRGNNELCKSCSRSQYNEGLSFDKDDDEDDVVVCPNCGGMLSGSPHHFKCVRGQPGEHQGLIDSDLLPPGTKEGGCGWEGTEEDARDEAGDYPNWRSMKGEGLSFDRHVDNILLKENGRRQVQRPETAQRQIVKKYSERPANRTRYNGGNSR